MGDDTQKIVSTEPARSRWTPKPEQILLLESIFNSGMVNPPKDETVRIRKLLEKFGPVGDANVFYWFQNRRSRSRRRQKQLQAGMGMGIRMPAVAAVDNRPCGVIMCDSIRMAIQTTTSSSSSNSSGAGGGFLPSSSGNSLVGDDTADDLFTISRQMMFPGVEEAPETMIPTSSAGDGSPCQSSTASRITVFINGVLTEVPSGAIDMRTMFGNDVILVHSSGEMVPSTEYGVLLQGLQMGESYFLVSNPSL